MLMSMVWFAAPGPTRVLVPFGQSTVTTAVSSAPSPKCCVAGCTDR